MTTPSPDETTAALKATTAALKATALAEKYGEALVQISDLLNDEKLTDARKVMRVRMVLVMLDSEGNQSGGSINACEGGSRMSSRRSWRCWLGLHVWGGNTSPGPGAVRACATCGKTQHGAYDGIEPFWWTR